jgi:hypothetical protein
MSNQVNVIRKGDGNLTDEEFDMLREQECCLSQKDHRRGGSFFVKTVVVADDENLPEKPHLHGFWETEQFVMSDEDTGIDLVEVLTRVEKKQFTEIVEKWVPVES